MTKHDKLTNRLHILGNKQQNDLQIFIDKLSEQKMIELSEYYEKFNKIFKNEKRI